MRSTIIPTQRVCVWHQKNSWKFQNIKLTMVANAIPSNAINRDAFNDDKNGTEEKNEKKTFLVWNRMKRNKSNWGNALIALIKGALMHFCPLFQASNTLFWFENAKRNKQFDWPQTKSEIHFKLNSTFAQFFIRHLSWRRWLPLGVSPSGDEKSDSKENQSESNSKQTFELPEFYSRRVPFSSIVHRRRQ